MRRFTSEYLRDTRRGLWDDRDVLSPLFVDSPERILDVGAGTGAFTEVLREETTAEVVALDADISLLRTADGSHRFGGMATKLPFRDDAFDLVVCQALLVNVTDPVAVLEEFDRVSAGRIGAIEPDNGAVTVESTVESEPRIARRARSAYMDGIETDLRLGLSLESLFRELGFREIVVAQMEHVRVIEPPYSGRDYESVRRKVTAERLDDHRETMLAGGLSPEDFEALRDDWQRMGRSVVEQVQQGTYRRSEAVPFYVAVGRATEV